MGRLSAVILDIDGTLVDSNDLHARAWLEAFAHFGIELSYDVVRGQIGKGADQLVPSLIGPTRQKQFGEELTEYRSQLFKDKYLSQVRGFLKVRELFQRNLRDGHKIALASSAKDDELKQLKRAAGIEDLVDEQTSSDDAEKSKPHPDIFAAALRRLRVDANKAIAVGDTPYDAIAATHLHIRSIGVLCGGFPKAELKQARCIEIYRDPSDLLRNYDRSALAEVQLAA